jgi:uncharacterized phage protein (TIGR01671 family)
MSPCADFGEWLRQYRLERVNPLKLENAILMQYTGLKDKNGTEIYEADVVTNEGIKAEIKYAVGATGFILYYKGAYIGIPADWENIEVIGNIYEHPELLS